jgi:hypothetical protein
MGLLLAHGGSLGWGAEYEGLTVDAVVTVWRMKKHRECFAKVGKVTAELRGRTKELQVRHLLLPFVNRGLAQMTG